MALTAHVLSLASSLPAPEGRSSKEYVMVTMRDGVALAASHYAPEPDDGRCPTVLVRTPYNRRHMGAIGRWFAGQRYHVLLQDTRGRCASEGVFDPLGNDEEDGQDTVRWIRAQPWFAACPRLGAWGASFMGILQWAGLSPADPSAQPDALVPIMCASQLYTVIQPDGAFALGLALRWHYLTYQLTADKSMLDFMRMLAAKMDRTCDPLFALGDLAQCDAAITGRAGSTPLGRYIQEHFASGPATDFWRHRDYRLKLPWAPPSHLIGGWYDFFLRELLGDFTALVANGRPACLTIGPWSHFDFGALLAGLELGHQWFERHLRDPTPSGAPAAAAADSHRRGEGGASGLRPGAPRRSSCTLDLPDRGAAPEGTRRSRSSGPCPEPPQDAQEHHPWAHRHRGAAPPPAHLRLPVRLYVMGRDEWAEYATWPPPHTVVPCYFGPNGALTAEPSSEPSTTTTTFRFDPKDPTPSVGGPEFHPRRAGRKPMADLERRRDVVAFTSEALGEDLEVVGPLSATLYLRIVEGDGEVNTSAPAAFGDVSVRLCIVTRHHLGGVRVENVAEGYRRLTRASAPSVGSGVVRVEVDLWATAQRWKAGQHLRVLVAPAAHPRLQALPATGPPLTYHIHHSASCPSAVSLAVVAGRFAPTHSTSPVPHAHAHCLPNPFAHRKRPGPSPHE